MSNQPGVQMTDKQPPPRADHNTQARLPGKPQLQLTSLLGRELGSHTGCLQNDGLQASSTVSQLESWKCHCVKLFLTVDCETVNESTASMTHRPQLATAKRQRRHVVSRDWRYTPASR